MTRSTQQIHQQHTLFSHVFRHIVTLIISIMTVIGMSITLTGCGNMASNAQSQPTAIMQPPTATPVPSPTPTPHYQLVVVPEATTVDFYVSDTPDSVGHYVMSVDARYKHPLFAEHAVLSPDGTHIAYTTSAITQTNNVVLWVADIQQKPTISPQNIATFNDEYWSYQPIWSPDSQQLAFITKMRGSAPDEGLQLWRIDRNGTNRILLAEGGDFRPSLFASLPQGVVQWALPQNIFFVNRWSSPPMRYRVDTTNGNITSSPMPKDPTVLEQTIPQRITPHVVCPVPTFNQKNYTDMMYSCNQTIARAGCAVGATSMVLAYYGVPTNPSVLNSCMGEDACPLWWSTLIEKCSNGAIYGIGFLEPFRYDVVDAELAEGRPVIVLVTSGEGTHFVVITAGEGQQPHGYRINDPVDGSMSRTLARYTDVGWMLEQTFRYGGVPMCAAGHGEEQTTSDMIYGETHIGIIDMPGVFDELFFVAEEGDYIELRVRATDTSLDPVVALYGTDDNYILHDDDSWNAPNALLRGTIPAAGRYRVRVYGYGTTVGNYTLSLVKVR